MNVNNNVNNNNNNLNGVNGNADISQNNNANSNSNAANIIIVMPGRKKRSMTTAQDFVQGDKCLHLQSDLAISPLAILQMMKVNLDYCIGG